MAPAQLSKGNAPVTLPRVAAAFAEKKTPPPEDGGVSLLLPNVLVAVHFVHFHQGDAGAAVGARHHRRIVTWLEPDQNSRLFWIGWRDRRRGDVARVRRRLPVVVLAQKRLVLE